MTLTQAGTGDLEKVVPRYPRVPVRTERSSGLTPILVLSERVLVHDRPVKRIKEGRFDKRFYNDHRRLSLL